MLSRLEPATESERQNQEYDMYSEILARGDSNPEHWYRRSRVVEKNAGCLAKLSFAVADLQQALARDPDNCCYLERLQANLRKLGDTEERSLVLRRLADLDGDGSPYQAVLEALLEGRNERLAFLRWMESNGFPQVYARQSGLLHDEDIGELSRGLPAECAGLLRDVFNAGRVLDGYDDLIGLGLRVPTSEVSRLAIHADVTSPGIERPATLARHVNIVPGGSCHFVLTLDEEHALASIGFVFSQAYGSLELIVRQIQGTKGAQPVLSWLRWEEVLLSVLERFGHEHGFEAVRVIAAESNPWVHRMHRWMIERGVIQPTAPIAALFQRGSLFDRAKASWESWWQEESQHPYYTRYLGLLDPRMLLLRYDRAAEKRGYSLCEEAFDAAGNAQGTKYWRKALR
jgi:hypothetical protein